MRYTYTHTISIIINVSSTDYLLHILIHILVHVMKNFTHYIGFNPTFSPKMLSFEGELGEKVGLNPRQCVKFFGASTKLIPFSMKRMNVNNSTYPGFQKLHKALTEIYVYCWTQKMFYQAHIFTPYEILTAVTEKLHIYCLPHIQKLVKMWII